ncbi:hypothetical protein HUK83_16985, partial [Endobacter medicaginis]
MAGVDVLAGALSGANAAYVADLYARWAADPGSVDASFIPLFEALDDEGRAAIADVAGASWGSHASLIGSDPAPAVSPVSGAAQP